MPAVGPQGGVGSTRQRLRRRLHRVKLPQHTPTIGRFLLGHQGHRAEAMGGQGGAHEGRLGDVDDLARPAVKCQPGLVAAGGDEQRQEGRP